MGEEKMQKDKVINAMKEDILRTKQQLDKIKKENLKLKKENNEMQAKQRILQAELEAAKKAAAMQMATTTQYQRSQEIRNALQSSDATEVLTEEQSSEKREDDQHGSEIKQ